MLSKEEINFASYCLKGCADKKTMTFGILTSLATSVINFSNSFPSFTSFLSHDTFVRICFSIVATNWSKHFIAGDKTFF